MKVTDTTTGITAKVDNANWIELTGADLKLNANEKLYVYKDIITVGTHSDLYYILDGNQITASETDEISGSLIFNGYLCQSAGFSGANAAHDAYVACFAK